MPLIRHLLRNDVLAAIKANIEEGVWTNTLPSERQLTDQYQVSRGTLRYALKNLQDEGIVQAVAGSGYLIKISEIKAQREPSSISIGILIGSPQESHESRSLAWIPALQQRIAKRQWNLHVHEGIPEISRSPAAGLKKLFRTTRHSCWLLIRCPEPVQKVFNDQKIPAIICGTPFDGIELPSIDLDYKAIGRHAAGYLAAKGHKRIGYVRSINPFPGDAESFENFKQGASETSAKPILKVIRYSDSNHDYRATLKQVKDTDNPLTALFVDSPFQFLSILTQALRAGIRIPEDLSLISRLDCDFFDYLNPVPARYKFDPRERANKIHHALESRIQGDTLRNHRTLLIPEFFPGSSVAKRI